MDHFTRLGEYWLYDAIKKFVLTSRPFISDVIKIRSLSLFPRTLLVPIFVWIEPAIRANFFYFFF